MSKDMNTPVNLTVEQHFILRTFKDKVDRMSREQAQQFLIELYTNMLVRENIYKDLVKTEWGL